MLIPDLLFEIGQYLDYSDYIKLLAVHSRFRNSEILQRQKADKLKKFKLEIHHHYGFFQLFCDCVFDIICDAIIDNDAILLDACIQWGVDPSMRNNHVFYLAIQKKSLNCLKRLLCDSRVKATINKDRMMLFLRKFQNDIIAQYLSLQLN